MQHLSTFYKENATSKHRAKHRAEVVYNEGVYQIHYYNINGELFKTESFEGKSQNYVEDAAENWTTDIKVLNG